MIMNGLFKRHFHPIKVKQRDGTPYIVLTPHITAIFEPMKQIMLDGNFKTGNGWISLDDESFERVLRAVDIK